ncbi:hypothetical protein GJ744_004436 [Endocarpon pusillum]|uniref:Tyrosinase copper-binding domain-containing protein n=1 Tax=Endocarpon pusillum TaxID=364733 RepID=A0A8H7AVW5_9EURO|nr:hypothetical protein GJ744_004436 [Endocarpon pusillum]
MYSVLGQSFMALFTLLCLCIPTEAAPRGPGGPTHKPNCPYNSVEQGNTRVLNRFWYDTSDLIESNGGYRAYTENHFFDDFSITDNTPNYPGPVKGAKLPRPGNYACSRLQFADIHSAVVPQAEAVLGKPDTDPTYPGGGGMDDNDCLIYRWHHRLLATLQKPYGGKPAGTNVSWYDTRVIKFQNYTADDNGQDYWIKSATVTMDWSDWYKS